MFNRASDPRTERSGPVSTQLAVICLVLFAALVAMLGGSSRFDAVQAVALRPAAALFLIPALYFLTRESIRTALAPLVILGLFTLWMGGQLVPLPPALWHSLPGRETIAQLDAMLGIEDTWRPIAWVPMRGWNALLSMIVPISAALLFVALRPKVRHVLLVLVGLGVVDAVIGLLQILSGSDSPLYFYRITNSGSPVGIFANENHSAVFSALILVVIARLGFGHRRRRNNRALDIVLAAAFLIVLLGVLASGSRAGLGLGLVAILASGLMGWLWLRRPAFEGEKTSRLAILARHPRLFLLLGAAAVGALLFALVQFGRAPGVIDAFNQNAFEDLRWRIGPILGQMMATHWLFGSGFGSFDAVYLFYEPTAFQNEAYVNQAHNDWAQIVIEGGLPAIVLLLAFGRWVFFALGRMYSRSAGAMALCLFWCTVMAILAGASLFDYPLRTPTFQMVAIWLVIALAFDVRDNIPQKAGPI